MRRMLGQYEPERLAKNRTRRAQMCGGGRASMSHVKRLRRQAGRGSLHKSEIVFGERLFAEHPS